MKSEFLFCGYYGYQNTGDDCFCSVGSWGANKFWGQSNVSFLATSLPILPFSGTPTLPSTALFKGHAFIARSFASLKSDIIVYLGGSILYKRPILKDYPFLHNLLLKMNVKEAAAIGVSLGPFMSKDDKEWIKGFLEKFSFISFRDNQSYKLARDMDLQANYIEAFDLAPLLPLIYDNKSISKKRIKSSFVLGVSVCNYESYTGKDKSVEELRNKRVIESLKQLSRKHKLIIKFFVFNNNPIFGDYQITKEYLEEIKGFCETEIIEYNPNPYATWSLINDCDGFLGVRLHSAIFAYTAKVPFVLVEYHPKCTDFLDNINYDTRIRMPAEFFDPSEAVPKLEEVFFAGDKEKLYRLNVDEAQSKAALNFTKAPWYTSN